MPKKDRSSTCRYSEKMISLIIPAFNEEDTVANVVSVAKNYVDEILVVDDGSTDRTALRAKGAGAKVISHSSNQGYLVALRTGFKEVRGSVIVTMDADGQHDSRHIPKITEPILKGEADLVLGIRRSHLSFWEKLITMLTRFRVQISDASTGFRALRREIAVNMKLKGKCPCGTFVLEAAELGARIKEVEVEVQPRRKGASRMDKDHLIQTLIVIKQLASVST